MLLTLSVISHQSTVLGPNAYKVFDERGGTIGRADNNFWMLPDPEKSISRTHAAVRMIAGSFFLEDLSVNGIFLRSTGEQIGRGEPYALRDGDRIVLGDYELLVTVLAGAPAQASPAQAPAAAPPPAPEAWPSPPAGTPWPSAPQQAYGAPAGAAPPGMPQGGMTAGGPEDLDPLRALGTPTGRTGPRPGTSGMPGAPGESYHDLRDRSPMEGHYQPPDVRFPPPQQAAPAAGGDSELTAFGHRPGAQAPPPAAWQQPAAPRADAWPPAPPATPPPAAPPAWGAPPPAAPAHDEHELTMFGHRPGAPAAPQGAPPPPAQFGAQPQPQFGAPPPKQPPPQFGTPPQQQPQYGAPPQPQPPQFGVPPQQQPQFGAPPQAQPPQFGAPPQQQAQFGAPPQPQPPQFGAPPQQQPQFGAPPQQPPPGQFGAPPPSAFAGAAQSAQGGWPDAGAQWGAQESPAPAPQYPPPPTAPAWGAPAPSAPAGGGPSIADMFASAGLDPSRVPPEMYPQLGFILRTVVQGTVAVLQARAQVKGTFRLPMTMIQPVENNPLKFSANFEDAMQNLFLKRTQGWLGPAESFQDAFDDLVAHEMAMVAGIRAAFASMLEKFSPQALEMQYERKAKRGGLFGGGKAAYWDLYRESFEELASDSEGNFQRLFGEEFAKAYHEQLQRLLAAQKHQRRRH